MRYKVRITETLISHIEVEACNSTDAERKADNAYQINVASATLDAEMSGVTCETLKEVI